MKGQVFTHSSTPRKMKSKRPLPTIQLAQWHSGAGLQIGLYRIETEVRKCTAEERSLRRVAVADVAIQIIESSIHNQLERSRGSRRQHH